MSVAFVRLQMISLSPFIPCINKDKAFFTEVLFVGLDKNSLEPCLISARMGILEHVGIVLPSRGIVPGRHHTSKTHVTGNGELKMLENNFPVIIDHPVEVRVQNCGRLNWGNHSMGREFY